MMRRHLLAMAFAVVVAVPHDAAAICGRKSCVVGSMPSGGGGGGGGYDPFAGMGGMVDMMFGVMGAIEAQQQQMARQNALDLNNRGIALYRNGDLVAAVAAFQQSLRLNPNDPNVRGNLEAAERELGDLRAREAERQQAERAAQQKRIAGLIDGIARRLDASTGAPPSAAADIDFMAPGGTSFFGTGGGPGGTARPEAPPVPARRPAAGNAPAYSAPSAPAASQPPLDFVGTKEPLFDKGGQASVPVDARGIAVAPRPPVPATPRLDFAEAAEVARPAAPATPDPIEYRSTGFRAWAVRNLAGPLMVGEVERNLASQTVPTIKVPPREGQPPPQMRPKPPMAAAEGLSAFEQRARELANLAFERIGAGDVESATRFLETADTLTKFDPRFGRALEFAKTVPQTPVSAPRAGSDGLLSNLPAPGLEQESAQSAFAGYRHLNNGDYMNATIEFYWARRKHGAVDGPRVRELSWRESQARLGAILSGQH